METGRSTLTATVPAMSSLRWPLRLGLLLGLPVVLGTQACSSSHSAAASSGTTVMFDAGADFTSTDHFFDFPWPSDLRLSSTGTPDLTGVANPTLSQVFEGLRQVAQQPSGFPVVPVAWFRFTTDLATRAPTDVIAADPSSPILLLDVDPASSTRGKLLPTVAETIVADNYVPDGVLAVGPRPGIVLEPRHEYAYVVLRAALDMNGAPLGVDPALATALSSVSSAVSTADGSPSSSASRNSTASDSTAVLKAATSLPMSRIRCS